MLHDGLPPHVDLPVKVQQGARVYVMVEEAHEGACHYRPWLEVADLEPLEALRTRDSHVRVAIGEALVDVGDHVVQRRPLRLVDCDGPASARVTSQQLSWA